VEHLHENKHLETFDREAMLELVKKLEMMEFIARSALVRILLAPQLWPHFANTTALQKFWALEEPQRRALWGDPIEPTDALADFDRSTGRPLMGQLGVGVLAQPAAQIVPHRRAVLRLDVAAESAVDRVCQAGRQAPHTYAVSPAWARLRSHHGDRRGVVPRRAEALDAGEHRAAPSRRNLPLDALEVESVETVLPAECSGCQIRNVALVRLGLHSGGCRKKGNHYGAARHSCFGHHILLRSEVQKCG
jgi:hypothetical protein